MNKEDLFFLKKRVLETNLQLPPDKPEETHDSTLRALWLRASGNPKSVDEAIRYPLPQLTNEQVRLLDALIADRIRKVPLAHLTGRQIFMGIEFLSDPRALIPRKETEILGNKALEVSKLITSKNGKAMIIDVCCGSGNLGLSVATHNPDCFVLAGDISDESVELTLDNIAHLKLHDRVKAEKSDLYEAFSSDSYEGKVDMIICNPPYVSSFKVSKMDSEISDNEPSLAFDGGMIGLRTIQRLINESPKFLKKGDGWLLFEVGTGQGEIVLKFCERSGHYSQMGTVHDSEGNIRVIVLRNK